MNLSTPICTCSCHHVLSKTQLHSTSSLATLDTLDAEYHRLLHALHNVGFRRNSLVPVNRLPPEMLQRIFLFVATPSPLTSRTVDHNYISFAEVCQYWRSVALRSAALSTCPQFSRPLLAARMLERSRPMLLDVRARFPPKPHDKPLHAALDVERHRIQSLRFSLDDEKNLEKVTVAMQVPLPALRDFGLDLIRDEDDSDDDEAELPMGTLMGLGAQLQQLVVRGVYLAAGLELNESRSLTCLILDPGHQYTYIKAHELLEIFRNNPRLRSVKLREVLHWDCDFTDKALIKLPILDELTIHQSATSAALCSILSRIQLRLGVRLDVTPLETDRSEIDILATALAGTAAEIVEEKLDYVKVEENFGHLRFFGWTLASSQSRPALVLRLHFGPEFGWDKFADVCFEHMATRHPVASALYWKVTGALKSFAWRKIIESSDLNLECLRLDGESFHGFLASFQDTGPPPPKMYLQVLTIEGADFSDDILETSLADCLLAALSKYRLYPEELRLIGCENIPEGFLDAIPRCEWVPDVIVSELHFSMDPSSTDGDAETTSGVDQNDWLYLQDDEDVFGWF